MNEQDFELEQEAVEVEEEIETTPTKSTTKKPDTQGFIERGATERVKQAESMASVLGSFDHETARQALDTESSDITTMSAIEHNFDSAARFDDAGDLILPEVPNVQNFLAQANNPTRRLYEQSRKSNVAQLELITEKYKKTARRRDMSVGERITRDTLYTASAGLAGVTDIATSGLALVGMGAGMLTQGIGTLGDKDNDNILIDFGVLLQDVSVRYLNKYNELIEKGLSEFDAGEVGESAGEVARVALPVGLSAISAWLTGGATSASVVATASSKGVSKAVANRAAKIYARRAAGRIGKATGIAYAASATQSYLDREAEGKSSQEYQDYLRTKTGGQILSDAAWAGVVGTANYYLEKAFGSTADISSFFGNATKGIAKSVIKSGLGEAFTEVAQDTTLDISDVIRGAMGNEERGITTDELLDRLISKDTLKTFVISSVIGGFTGGAEYASARANLVKEYKANLKKALPNITEKQLETAGKAFMNSVDENVSGKVKQSLIADDQLKNGYGTYHKIVENRINNLVNQSIAQGKELAFKDKSPEYQAQFVGSAAQQFVDELYAQAILRGVPVNEVFDVTKMDVENGILYMYGKEYGKRPLTQFTKDMTPAQWEQSQLEKRAAEELQRKTREQQKIINEQLQMARKREKEEAKEAEKAKKLAEKAEKDEAKRQASREKSLPYREYLTSQNYAESELTDAQAIQQARTMAHNEIRRMPEDTARGVLATLRDDLPVESMNATEIRQILRSELERFMALQDKNSIEPIAKAPSIEKRQAQVVRRVRMAKPMSFSEGVKYAGISKDTVEKLGLVGELKKILGKNYRFFVRRNGTISNLEEFTADYQREGDSYQGSVNGFLELLEKDLTTKDIYAADQQKEVELWRERSIRAGKEEESRLLAERDQEVAELTAYLQEAGYDTSTMSDDDILAQGRLVRDEERARMDTIDADINIDVDDDLVFSNRWLHSIKEQTDLADENARLDEVNPEYTGETIRIIDPVELKQAQFEIVQETNPMQDDYHVGIRSVDDIKTFDETINDEESFVWGDYSREDAQRDLAKNEITVYSSYPIENGVFVSTSYRQAQEYAGGKGKKVYERTVPLDFVAWINGDEGQFAMTDVIGKKRTVYNSNGERIAKSEPALRNFWNWFGDSKVVDEDGRPLVVYHGSDVSGIEVFDNQANQTKQRQIGAEKGYFFTDSKKVAERFRTPEQRKAESKYYVENTVREPVEEEKYDAQGRYLGSVHYVKTTLPEYKNFGLYPVYLKAESVNEYNGEDIGVGVERETALESAKQSGKDGVIIYNADTGAGIANEYIVFEPNQIKSTQNRGTFSSDTGNIYYQTIEPAENKELVVTHGISINSLEKSLDLGGFPMPSIAITKATEPLADFGTISLVGTKNMIDPANPANKVYDRDIWSTTFPTKTYKNAKRADISKFRDKFNDTFKKAEDLSSLDGSILYYAQNSSRPEQAVDSFVYSDGAKIYYIENVLGEKVDVPTYDKAKKILDNSVIFVKADEKFIEDISAINLNKIDRTDDLDAVITKPIQDLLDRFDFVGEYGDKAKVYEEHARQYYSGDKFDFGSKYHLVQSIKEYIRSQGQYEVDKLELSKMLRDKIKDDSNYETWATKQIEELLGEPKVAIGKKLEDWTLTNIVKAMIKNAGINAQKSLVYGSGKVIASGAKKLSSIKEIKEIGKSLKSKEEASQDIEKIQDSMDKYTSQFMTANDVSYSLNQKEEAYMALGRAAGKTPTKKSLQSALNYEFGNQTIYDDKVLEEGVEIIKAVQKLSRHYFEAKPQRIVRIEEFVGAVVPTDKKYDNIAKRLTNIGLKVERNDRLNEGIQNIENEIGGVLFHGKKNQLGQRNLAAWNPLRRSIELFTGANETSIMHELSHFWLDNMMLYSRLESAARDSGFAKVWNNIKKYLNIDDRQERINESQAEKYTSAYMQYIRNTKIAPVVDLGFKGMDEFIGDISLDYFENAKHREADGTVTSELEIITPEMVDAFQKLTTTDLNAARDLVVSLQDREFTDGAIDSQLGEESTPEQMKTAVAKQERETRQKIAEKSTQNAERDSMPTDIPQDSKTMQNAQNRLDKEKSTYEVGTTDEESFAKAREIIAKDRARAEEIVAIDPNGITDGIANSFIALELARQAVANGKNAMPYLESFVNGASASGANLRTANMLNTPEFAWAKDMYEASKAKNYAVALRMRPAARNAILHRSRIAQTFESKLDQYVEELYPQLLQAQTYEEQVKIINEWANNTAKKIGVEPTSEVWGQSVKGTSAKKTEFSKEVVYQKRKLKEFLKSKIGATLTDAEQLKIRQLHTNTIDAMRQLQTNPNDMETAKEFIRKAREYQDYLNALAPVNWANALLSSIPRASMLFRISTQVKNTFGTRLEILLSDLNRQLRYGKDNLISKKDRDAEIKKSMEMFLIGGFSPDVQDNFFETPILAWGEKQYSMIQRGGERRGAVFSMQRIAQDTKDIANYIGDNWKSGDGAGKKALVAGRIGIAVAEKMTGKAYDVLAYSDAYMKAIIATHETAKAATFYAQTISKEKGWTEEQIKEYAEMLFKDARSYIPKTKLGVAIRKQAVEQAKIETFIKNGTIAEFANRVRAGINLGKESGIGTFISPYVSTAANIMQLGIDYTTGWWRRFDGWKEVKNRIYENAKKGEPIDQKDMEYLEKGYRGTYGGLFLLTMLALFKSAQELTGEDDTLDYVPPYSQLSARERAYYKQVNGGKYNSVKIGDLWVSAEYFGGLSNAITNLGTWYHANSVISAAKGLIAETPVIGDLVDQYQKLEQDITYDKDIIDIGMQATLNQAEKYIPGIGKDIYKMIDEGKILYPLFGSSVGVTVSDEAKTVLDVQRESEASYTSVSRSKPFNKLSKEDKRKLDDEFNKEYIEEANKWIKRNPNATTEQQKKALNAIRKKIREKLKRKYKVK